MNKQVKRVLYGVWLTLLVAVVGIEIYRFCVITNWQFANGPIFVSVFTAIPYILMSAFKSLPHILISITALSKPFPRLQQRYDTLKRITGMVCFIFAALMLALMLEYIIYDVCMLSASLSSLLSSLGRYITNALVLTAVTFSCLLDDKHFKTKRALAFVACGLYVIGQLLPAFNLIRLLDPSGKYLISVIIDFVKSLCYSGVMLFAIYPRKGEDKNEQLCGISIGD